ncbi:MAG: TIGR03067 domain-containing protein [Opitutae bacterium]|nr:TIGR03067 domain-containing protein [Opitutae bacterium]
MNSPSLEGRWQPLYAELDGEQAPQEVLQQTEFELDAGIYTVRFGGVAADTGSFTVDADTAHHLTLHGAVGPNAGRTIPCLFKFIDDTLMICFGLGGTRPKNFRTAPGAQLYLVTYSRR